MLFEKLRVLTDSVPRSGPENMAIDEALIQEAQQGPILRQYRWAENWASLGYFQKLADAKAVFEEEVNLVRRWTAGGLVDHRLDTTYSLIIPASEKAAQLRGGEGYGEIHRAVAAALQRVNIPCELIEKEAQDDSLLCFEKPVRWDVVGENGKLAGAGQRRGKWGVLHQGSVLGNLICLAEELAEELEEFQWQPKDLKVEKYESESWLSLR